MRLEGTRSSPELVLYSQLGHEGTKAFDSPFVRRSALERASGLDRALITHGDVAEARDFRERYRAMRASADRSRARP
jgi:hypothetical protein